MGRSTSHVRPRRRAAHGAARSFRTGRARPARIHSRTAATGTDRVAFVREADSTQSGDPERAGTGDDVLVFRYLLVLPDDEPNDPASFVTAVPNWSVGETITLGEGEQLRILGIEAEIALLVDRGFDGVFTVEPA